MRSSRPVRVGTLCLALAMALSLSARDTAHEGTTLSLATGQPAATPAKALECLADCGTRAAVTALAFSPDGRQLAAGGYGEVVLWDVEQGKLARRLGQGHLSGQVQALAFHPAGRLLAIGEGVPGRQGAVRVIDLASGDMVASFEDPTDVPCSIDFSPDGSLLAAGGYDAKVRVWKTDEKKLVATLADCTACVRSVRFSPDGKRLAAGGADRAVLVFGVEDWKSASRHPAPDEVQGVAFGADGLIAAAAGDSVERALHWWPKDPKGNRLVDLFPDAPVDMVWMGKTGKLAIACTDGVLRVHDPAKNQTPRFLTGHTDWTTCVASNADGSRLATGALDGLVKLLAGDGKLLATFAHLSVHDDRWLVLGAPGYVECSDPSLVHWKTPKAITEPPDKLAERLHNAGLLRDVLAGKNVPAPDLK